jgi:hypothetical protein
VGERTAPTQRIRGPATFLSAMAARSAKTTSGLRAPTSRTVVKPAASVTPLPLRIERVGGECPADRRRQDDRRDRLAVDHHLLHRGDKPFTARDVKCTWGLVMDTGSDKLRINPRKSWYSNVAEVTTGGDYEATFRLKRPQPALLALLASGWAPIYPCHVPARDMRQHPIGTGPFKFVECATMHPRRYRRRRLTERGSRAYRGALA